MRPGLLLPLLAAAAAAGGCAGSSHPMAVPVHGDIQTIGGPAPGAPRPIAGARFRLVGNGATVSVKANASGRFGVALAPGTCRVQLTSHVPMSDGTPLPARPRQIHVDQAPTGPVHLVIDIK